MIKTLYAVLLTVGLVCSPFALAYEYRLTNRLSDPVTFNISYTSLSPCFEDSPEVLVGVGDTKLIDSGWCCGSEMHVTTEHGPISKGVTGAGECAGGHLVVYTTKAGKLALDYAAQANK